MKAIIAFAALAACIATSYCAPAVVTGEVDWAEISTKITDYAAYQRGWFTWAKAFALEDNLAVGTRIAVKLDATLLGRTAIILRLTELASKQTLTEVQTRTLLNEMAEIISNVEAKVQDDINQLSEKRAEDVRNMLNLAFLYTGITADDIVHALVLRG